MPTKALTKDAVERLSAKATPYIMFDAKLPTFGVRVRPTGKRSYILQYRVKGDRRVRFLTIGTHGALTVDQARAIAKKHLGAIANGSDPALDLQHAKAAPTVAAVAPQYIERQSKLRTKTTADWTARLFAKYILPAFGPRRIAEITTADVANLHGKLSDKPIQANRVLAILSAFFSYAEKQGHRAPFTNPCKHVDRYREQSKEYFLTAAELARLSVALKLAETKGLGPTAAERTTAARRNKSMRANLPVDPDVIAAIRLLLFTGCRKGEVLGLRWADVDLDQGVLNLGATKTGRSTRPLNASAREILRERYPLRVGPFVFPGGDDFQQPRADITKVWFRIREAAELNHVRIHDFRHTVATTALSAGVSWPLIGGLLGHKHPSTTQKYAHLANDPLARASEKMGADMAAALSGTETPVTPLHQRQG